MLKVIFKIQIAPYASCIVNGIFWRPNDPRLLETEDAAMLQSAGVPKVSPLVRHHVADSVVGCPKLPHRYVYNKKITC